MPGLGLGLTIGGKGGGGLDSLPFVFVSETDDTATYSMSPALIVEESEWAVGIYIPDRNFVSEGAESVTVEA